MFIIVKFLKGGRCKSEKWTNEIDVNSDIWRGEICDSREEAIEEGRKDAIYYGKKNFKIGIIEEVPNFGVDAEGVIEDIQNDMYGEMGEVAEDYLDDVTKEHLSELEDQLNEVFYKWQEKYNYKPTFYKVISEEIIEI